MEAVYEVVNSEVAKKGRIFANETAFLNWLSHMAGYRRHGLTADEFFGGFQTLVETHRLDVYRRRGNVKVKVVDKG